MDDVAEPGVAEFPVDFRGRLIEPTDPDYDQARSLWNAGFDRRPTLIARCTGSHDVVIALGVARERGWEIAVRGGGHSYTGAGVDDGVVIDLTEMRAVDVDPVARRAAVGGGATWLGYLAMFVLDRQYSRVTDGNTAFGGRRRDGWAIAVTAECHTPEELAADKPWAQALWADLLPHASNAGGYINFHAEHDTQRVQASCGPETYDQLAAIKRAYDPNNVFHRNANIAPARTPGHTEEHQR